MNIQNKQADLVVIGGGSGGLSVAAGAAQLGIHTVLIERGHMGGDCLNTGCVPSKALLAAAKRAHLISKNDISGITAQNVAIDFATVKDHVMQTIATIAPNDSEERFRGLGVDVMKGDARFISPHTVIVNGQHITAKNFVIATGTRAFIPPIQGLDPARTLTNETIFALREKPEHLIIIGGGPIGIEMATAHNRLGVKVSVLDLGQILPRDDQDCVSVLRAKLIDEGVALYENIIIQSVAYTSGGIDITVTEQGATRIITGSHLLVAAGRKPNIESLGLDAANIAYTKSGVTVDARLRSTTQKYIYAAGDVAGGPQFTHVAGYHAGIIIRNLCFKIPAKVDYTALPWVTYTDPELAQVGLTEKQARMQHGSNIRVARWDFHENDRAIAERQTKGFVKVITTRKGLILGVSIIGTQAGELIGMWALAITKQLKVGDITSMIAPYPTLGEASKRAAGAWYTPTLFSDKTRKIVRFLQKLPF